MKYVTAFLLFAICVIGIFAIAIFMQDKPTYAEGEPAALVKEWLKTQPEASGTIVTAGYTDVDENSDVWLEKYLGDGKWIVSKADLPSDFSKSDMTFEEWIAKTKGWDAARLTEYASDLSPEEQESFQEELRMYNSGQSTVDVIDQWYVYENTGLVEAVID